MLLDLIIVFLLRRSFIVKPDESNSIEQLLALTNFRRDKVLNKDR